jgi:hypothetical protein
MTIDLEKRLDAICESLESQRLEFEKGVILCTEVVEGMHQRLERVEKWMSESLKQKAPSSKIHMIGEKKKSPTKRLSP